VVQPKSQAKPQVREVAKPQQSRPKSGEVQPQHLQQQGNQEKVKGNKKDKK
jgi:hypothetical protein